MKTLSQHLTKEMGRSTHMALDPPSTEKHTFNILEDLNPQQKEKILSKAKHWSESPWNPDTLEAFPGYQVSPEDVC